MHLEETITVPKGKLKSSFLNLRGVSREAVVLLKDLLVISLRTKRWAYKSF